MLKKVSLFLVIISFLSFAISNNFRALVIEKLAHYSKNYPEKIYVQTDKPYYTLGEDLWFSAYLVNGITHQESQQSNVIYVELINAQDSIVQKRQLLVKDLSTAGDFKLKKNWKPGNYTLRAYSNYMRNEDSDYFFQAKIPVWDVPKTDTPNVEAILKTDQKTPERALDTKPEIGFYPESGYLVNNISSKIAIKVKTKLAPDTNIEGVIKNSKDEIIAPFSIYKFGLGVVKLTPEPNTSYYASVTINGKAYKYELPKALQKGYHLEVSNTGKQVLIQVNSNSALGLKNTFLVAHQRGNLIYEKLESEDLSSYKVALDTKFLQDGVTNITLFNSSGKPVCERLVYVDNPNNAITVNLNTAQQTLSTEETVDLEIGISNATGKALYGNLSMSITDLDAVEQDTKNENIKTYLLLNSDLRGTIEDPGYFFQKENDFRRLFLLDLLMLTHGWRRFNWQDVLYNSAKKHSAFETEKGIYISGRTTALKGGRQQISVPTRLTIMGVTPHQENQKSNTKGKFKYGPFVFSDTLNILLEARRNSFSKQDLDIKTNRDVAIHLDNLLANSPDVALENNPNILTQAVKDSSKIVAFLKQAKRNSKFEEAFLASQIQLEEVIIQANKKDAEEKRRQELNEKTIYGNPTHRFDLSTREDQRIFDIIDLINQIPSVQANNERISIRNQGSPAILLDGFPTALEDILFLTGEDIEFIDVIDSSQAFFTSNASNGVIAIYSREGGIISNANIKRKPGIIDFTAHGFYTARTFYTDTTENEFKTTPNTIKSTLYWTPKIVLSEANAGLGKTSFKTTDTKSNYAIKIEGITTEGIPFYHLSTIEVK